MVDVLPKGRHAVVILLIPRPVAHGTVRLPLCSYNSNAVLRPYNPKVEDWRLTVSVTNLSIKNGSMRLHH